MKQKLGRHGWGLIFYCLKVNKVKFITEAWTIWERKRSKNCFGTSVRWQTARRQKCWKWLKVILTERRARRLLMTRRDSSTDERIIKVSTAQTGHKSKRNFKNKYETLRTICHFKDKYEQIRVIGDIFCSGNKIRSSHIWV